MILKDEKPGKIFRILDVPKNEPCVECKNCLRVRLMEFGFLPGVKVQIQKHHRGLWLLDILNDNNITEQTIALRDEEAERLLFEDQECSIGFSVI
jgi:Fe2+ transport system protein FeoA